MVERRQAARFTQAMSVQGTRKEVMAGRTRTSGRYSVMRFDEHQFRRGSEVRPPHQRSLLGVLLLLLAFLEILMLLGHTNDA